MQRTESGVPHRVVDTSKLLSLAVLPTVISTLIGLGACGSGQSNPAENSAGQPRTITGTEIVSYVTETGTVDVPDDLSKTPITAYVPNGSSGYDAITGSGTSDGHYIIPNVAAGYYLLQIGSSYFWTSANNIDTGSQVQGRPHSTQSAIGEHLNINVALSVPIESPAGIFELVDFNTSSASTETSWNAGSSIFNQSLYWVGTALIQASMGDKAYFVHLNQTSHWGGAGETSYIVGTQSEMTPALSIEMTSGVVSNVNSAATQGTPETFRGNFELSAFGALNTEIATGTDQSFGYLVAGVAAAPPSAGQGGFPELFDSNRQLGILATFEIFPFSASSPDLDLGDVNYRNGFPADYKKLVFARWGVPVNFTVPVINGVSPSGLTAYISLNSLTMPAANRPISPLLGPVTNLSLDSVGVFSSPLTNASLTPNITWGPPNLGNASFYQIDLLQFTTGACGHYECAVPTNVATFQTQQTNLKLPPGLLLPSSTYVLVVTAKNAVAANLGSAPMRTTYPFAYADAVSQPFTTAGAAPAEVVGAARIGYGPLMRNRKDVLKNNLGFAAVKTHN